MELDASFGYWLRRRRKALDLTQEALAQRVGCSPATIRKLEGDERRPSRQVAALLADALEIDDQSRPIFLQVARGERRTERLAALLPPGNRAPLRPRRATPFAPGLPAPSTPLIGRGAELAELTRLLLHAECRLLTMVGASGMGKTRLAIAVASSQLEHFKDGVAYVALASPSTADHLVAAIAKALAFVFAGAAEPKRQLFNYLRDKQMLIVLDNMEHLLDGIAWLAPMLQAAPELKLFAIARQRLNLAGEWVFELQGLPTPPPLHLSGTAQEAIEGYSAVALFIEQAQRVRAGFALSDQNQTSIAHICRLVNGVPLEIERAAAWLSVLSCEEIAQEIERDSGFLAASGRAAPAR